MYRVRLRPGPVPGSDYINSSFVDVRAHCFKVHEHTIETEKNSYVLCMIILIIKNPLVITAALQGYKLKGAYIATQGPLKSTVADFWRMVQEFQCGCIVMLCELEEDGQVWGRCQHFIVTQPC